MQNALSMLFSTQAAFGAANAPVLPPADAGGAAPGLPAEVTTFALEVETADVPSTLDPATQALPLAQPSLPLFAGETLMALQAGLIVPAGPVPVPQQAVQPAEADLAILSGPRPQPAFGWTGQVEGDLATVATGPTPADPAAKGAPTNADAPMDSKGPADLAMLAKGQGAAAFAIPEASVADAATKAVLQASPPGVAVAEPAPPVATGPMPADKASGPTVAAALPPVAPAIAPARREEAVGIPAPVAAEPQGKPPLPQPGPSEPVVAADFGTSIRSAQVAIVKGGQTVTQGLPAPRAGDAVGQSDKMGAVLPDAERAEAPSAPGPAPRTGETAEGMPVSVVRYPGTGGVDGLSDLMLASKAGLPSPAPAFAPPLVAAPETVEKGVPVPAAHAMPAMAGAEVRMRLLGPLSAVPEGHPLQPRLESGLATPVPASVDGAVPATLPISGDPGPGIADEPVAATGMVTAAPAAPGPAVSGPGAPMAPAAVPVFVAAAGLPREMGPALAPQRLAAPAPLATKTEKARAEDLPPEERSFRRDDASDKPAAAPPERALLPVAGPVTQPGLPLAEAPVAAFDPAALVPSAAGSSRTEGASPLPSSQPAGAPPAAPAPPQTQIVAAVTGSQDGVTELRLSPEELGSVRIEMRTDGDNVVMVVSAERQDTQDLLRRHADRLVAEMRAAGFAEANVAFGQWSGSDRQHGQPMPQLPSMADAGDAMTAPLPPAPAHRAQANLPAAGLYLRI